MKSIAALPVLIAFLVGALPAHAWTWPVAGPVLQPFQLRSDPYAPGQHRGIDVGAPPGTTVFAPADGVVSFAGTVPRSGRVLTIATPNGFAVTLVHLGAVAVARGGTVQEGAPVGAIGPSGDPEHAEGYVHLGVRVAADPHGYVDPESLLPPPPVPAPVEEGEAPDPAEIPGDEVPAEPPEEAESPPAEPGGGSEPGTSKPDPAGEAESPAEPGSEDVAGDPPPAAEPVPEPGESTPVPAGEEPAREPVEPDRVGVEAPAVPSAEGVPPVPSVQADAPGLGEESGDYRPNRRQRTPPAEIPAEVDAAPAMRDDTPSSPARLVAQSAPASQADSPGSPGQANGTAGAGTVLVAAIGAAALAALGAVLGGKRRRRSRHPTEPNTDDFLPAVGSQEMPCKHAGHGGTARAELDLSLAELLGPKTPCRSRFARGGHVNARRRTPPRRRVIPSKAAPAQGARSARAG
jgi:Peptidase family M23